MKKIIKVFMLASLITMLFTINVFASDFENKSVNVNGIIEEVSILNVEGEDYISLRHFAQLMIGEKNFKIDVTETRIFIETNAVYEGEIQETITNLSPSYKKSNYDIFVNGAKLEADILNVSGNTYVKLRDMAIIFDINISFGNNITINTNESCNLNLTSEEIFMKASLATVRITCMDATGQSICAGSGFIIDESGLMLTNFHVLETATDIYVELNGSYTKMLVTDVISYNAETDIVLLQLQSDNYYYLELDMDYEATIGETIYSLGSPYSLFNTFAIGNISQIYDGQLQITAPISQGSSGGPLLNKNAKVIGITTSGILEGSLLGFAITIDTYNTLEELNLSMYEYGEIVPYPAVTSIEMRATSNSRVEVFFTKINGIEDYILLYKIGDGQWEESDIITSKEDVVSVVIKSIEDNTVVQCAVIGVLNGKISKISDIVSARTYIIFSDETISV